MLLGMKNSTFATLEPSFHFPPSLDVTRAGDQEIVHVGATPIANYAVSDVTTRRHLMVQLAEAGPFKACDIAETFQVTPIYVSQLRARYRQQGATALSAGRPGPKSPLKVNARLKARVRQLGEAGLSYRAIAEKLSGERTISYQTVRRILQQAAPHQQSLAMAAEAEAAAAQPPVNRPPVLPQGETRYAGAMLLHVALGLMGLWSVFEQLGARLGPTKLAVQQLVGIIALGFALRLKSIEGFKTALRRDFGLLLGLPAIPAVQTLRTQIAALAESVAPDQVMQKLLEGFLQLEPVWEGAYFVDGHFCPYSGGRPVAKGWNSKRRLVEAGQTDVYVHDASGRALFFINRPCNDHLAKVLPQIVAPIRAVAPQHKILLIFDRGGYSGPVFKELTRQNIGFITYLKGRKAKRRFAADRFQKRWWEVQDPSGIEKTRRYVYSLYEKGTRVQGAGVLRTLVMADHQEQVPILTNEADMAAAKVVHLLKMRWRQENSLKYLSEHYSIEQLIQHEATYEEDQRWVDNPRREQLRQQIQKGERELIDKEAELGRTLEAARQLASPPTGALKRLLRSLRQQIKALSEKLQRLQQRWAHTPAKIPLRQLQGKSSRATLKTDRRNLVNAIKIATYNAERLLARQFFRHYQDQRDWLTVFRAILHLPGSITYQEESQQMQVTLRSPDSPRVRQALAAMLEEINALGPCAFGNSPKLKFKLNS